jgi:hypothetical protein
MSLTYGELLEALALARADTVVRVKLGNGQVRELAGAELEWDVEELGTTEAATGEPQRSHTLTGAVLVLE